MLLLFSYRGPSPRGAVQVLSGRMLRGEGRAFSRTLVPQFARAAPRHNRALTVSDRYDRIVESGLDVGHTISIRLLFDLLL